LSQKICHNEKLIFKKGTREKTPNVTVPQKKYNHLNLHGSEGLSQRMLTRRMKDSEIHHSMEAGTRRIKKIDIQVDVSKQRNS
jgi:hypothetical protein